MTSNKKVDEAVSSALVDKTGVVVPSDDLVARSVAAQEFGEYLGDSDTDTENATAPSGRR